MDNAHDPQPQMRASVSKLDEGRSPDVLLLGRGRIGSLLAAAAERQGLLCSRCDVTDWQEAVAVGAPRMIAAVNRGTDVLDVVRFMENGGGTPPADFLDLTTHSTRSSLAVCTVAERLGVKYHGGGITGGVAGLQQCVAVFFVGPSNLEARLRAVLDELGATTWFDTAGGAVTAKLLHNLVLLGRSWFLAQALKLSRDADLSDDQLAHAIGSGPAGRPIEKFSQFRDSTTEVRSSYLARQASKDLEQLVESFPDLQSSMGVLLDMIGSALQRGPRDRPFTESIEAAMNEFGIGPVEAAGG